MLWPELPGVERERSGAVDARARVAVVRPGLLQEVGRLDRARRDRHVLVEHRVRLGQVDGDLHVAGLLDGLHVAVDAGPVRTDLRVEVQVEGGHHVVRGEGLAAVKGHSVTDRVDPGRGVGVVDGRGQAGRDRQVGVPAQQALAHVREDRVGRVVEGVRVGQRERLRVQRPREGVDVAGGLGGSGRDLVRRTAVGARLPVGIGLRGAAAGDQQEGRAEHRTGRGEATATEVDGHRWYLRGGLSGGGSVVRGQVAEKTRSPST